MVTSGAPRSFGPFKIGRAPGSARSATPPAQSDDSGRIASQAPKGVVEVSAGGSGMHGGPVRTNTMHDALGRELSLNLVLSDVDGLKHHARKANNRFLVQEQEQREAVARAAVYAVAILMFLLHFIIFPFAIVAFTLVFGTFIWLVMLLPSLRSAVLREDAAKRKYTAAMMDMQEQHASDGKAAHVSNIWLKCPKASMIRDFAHRIRNSPEYWVARLVRLGFYLSCYVASTYWMGERTEQGMWVVEEVPSFFFIVNFISLWTNYYDFTLDLLLDRWTFFFSLGSFVELTTQPPFIIVVSGLISGLRGLQWEGFNGEPRTVGEVWQLNQLSSDPNLYLLQFGFLRFLAAHNVSNIMLTKLQVHSTRVRIVALIIAVTCIFSVIAGAIFFLEARLNGNDTFVNYFDFLYFAVVTGCTVGYGDFSPSTPLSRLVVIIVILATIAVVPAQVEKLREALAEEPLTLGTPPRAGDPYVLVTGSLSPWQLGVFVRNFEKSVKDNFHKPPSKIVVLSPLPIRTYDSISTKGSGVSFFFCKGDLLTSPELGTPRSILNLRDVEHAFVYGGNAGSPDDDEAAMLRVLSLLNFLPASSITTLITRATNQTMATNLGAWSTVCVNDLQMRWLAKSVTDTPGIICLMSNLLISVSTGESARKLAHGLKEKARAASAVRGAARGQEEDGEEDANQGASDVGHQSKRGRLTRTNTGSVRFSTQQLDRLHRVYGSDAALLRRNSKFGASRRRSASGLRTAVVGVDSDMLDYLLGAESHLHVSHLPPWAIGKQAATLFNVFAHMDGMQLLAVSDGRTMHIFRDVLLVPSMLGIYICRSDRDLIAFLRTEKPPAKVAELLALGSPTPGAKPERALQGAHAARMPPKPRVERPRAEKPRAEKPPFGEAGLGWIMGKSAKSSRAELTNTQLSGLLRGERIVILGAPDDVEMLIAQLLGSGSGSLTGSDGKHINITHISHAPFPALPRMLEKYGGAGRGARARYAFVQEDPLDHEVLKAHLLTPGLHSVLVFHSHLRSGSELQLDAAVCAAKVENMLLQTSVGSNRARVFVSAASTTNTRFIETSTWWPHLEDGTLSHITSPTYAAGMVFANEMLFPLMASWRKNGLVTFCRNLTDPSLDSVCIKLFDLPPQLARKAQPIESLSSSKLHAYKHQPHASSRDARRDALTYGELRIEMLRIGRLPIGLYRFRSSSNQSDKALKSLPFVFTNPPNSTIVRARDRVYALELSAIGSLDMHQDRSGRRLDEAARKIQETYRNQRIYMWRRARAAELERDGVVKPPPSASARRRFFFI